MNLTISAICFATSQQATSQHAQIGGRHRAFEDEGLVVCVCRGLHPHRCARAAAAGACALLSYKYSHWLDSSLYPYLTFFFLFPFFSLFSSFFFSFLTSFPFFFLSLLPSFLFSSSLPSFFPFLSPFLSFILTLIPPSINFTHTFTHKHTHTHTHTHTLPPALCLLGVGRQVQLPVDLPYQAPQEESHCLRVHLQTGACLSEKLNLIQVFQKLWLV